MIFSNISKMMLQSLSILTVLYIVGASEEANSTEQQINFSSPKAVDQFLKQNNTCIAMDDGCTTCAVNRGELVCSMPRIACIPRELECTLSFKSDDDDGSGK